MNPFKKLVGVAFSQSNKRQLTFGKVPFSESSLFTNILATGAIGSGKTAAFIRPLLDKFAGLYKNENPNAPDAKWGGLVLDVKGDLHEALIYSMQKNGRDVLKDLIVVRPDNDYYVVEFEEVTTGQRFCVSATGGTSEAECDKVLVHAAGAPNILHLDSDNRKFIPLANGDMMPLNSWIFGPRGSIATPDVENAIKAMEFIVSGQDIRWLGWRTENGRLVRITHTHSRQVQYALSAGGDKTYTETPKVLRYVSFHSINNGLTYNLIPKDIPSTAVAERLMAVAEVTGNSMGGDNAYWSNASEKHIAYCTELFRQVEENTGRECSINDIQRFTTDDVYLQDQVDKLKALILEKQLQGVSDYEILLLRNLEKYFTEEWLKHDPKTKGNIMSCVTNLFGDVTRNQQLVKTFCDPSKFTFDDCMNEGKVYTLMMSAYPNAQMLVGTSMKLDFQQTILKRTTNAQVNKTRPLLFLADEYQWFITTGGKGKNHGDAKFLSVTRQMHICNIICIQAVASLLAIQQDEHKINAFLQCFGSRIFFQNLDEKTSLMAKQLTQFGKNEKHATGCTSIPLSLATTSFTAEEEQEIISFMTKYGGRLNIVQNSPLAATSLDAIWAIRNQPADVAPREVTRQQADSGALTQLKPFEAVIFNKENTKKVVKTDLREDALFYSTTEIRSVVNDYYRSYLENRFYELKLSHLLNTAKKTWPVNIGNNQEGMTEAGK